MTISILRLTFFFLDASTLLSTGEKEPKNQAPVKTFGKIWLFATAVKGLTSFGFDGALSRIGSQSPHFLILTSAGSARRTSATGALSNSFLFRCIENPHSTWL